MVPHRRDNDPLGNLELEVQRVTNALAEALEEAGIRLPQFTALGGAESEPEWLVRLGNCNVGVGLELYRLVKDGLYLRQTYPEESVNA
ncbi:hypothetical protein ACFY5K_25540 [Streptomyces griseofuscus]|uniref:hypothetical protein n=1 Tax=Streptomyces griseofuscus TaxID=146922 RepID=UPI003686F764